jgi:hypothetical protein
MTRQFIILTDTRTSCTARNKHSIKRFQLFTVVNVNSVVLWFVVPCNLVVGTNISEKFCLHPFNPERGGSMFSGTAMFFYKATCGTMNFKAIGWEV